ncbi:hypothetical protein [Amycolatopsis sp. lyj-23]|uniref:hypothetical protein n=1 Tax=Amycolatopsis sp. lyj-23 TaxID=2789283 RepID=UPI00397BF4CA
MNDSHESASLVPDELSVAVDVLDLQLVEVAGQIGQPEPGVVQRLDIDSEAVWHRTLPVDDQDRRPPYGSGQASPATPGKHHPFGVAIVICMVNVFGANQRRTASS